MRVASRVAHRLAKPAATIGAFALVLLTGLPASAQTLERLKSTGTIRLVLAYLIGKDMDPLAAGTILFQLNCFIPALAVNRANAAQRKNLEKLLSSIEANDPFDRYDLLRLVHCVSTLADSPILDLFSRCLSAYEARFHPSLAQRLPAHLHSSYFRLVRNLLDRLPAGKGGELDWAKAASSRVMLDMSDKRPF